MMMMKLQNQFNGVEGLEQRRNSIMVGPRSNGTRPRQPYLNANGRRESYPASAPPSAPGSNAGSDVGGLDFTKEDVEVLLNERMKTKNKFNYKERCEQMLDYIKRLRLCIRWFQEVEGGYLLEQENLRELLEAAQRQCSEMEMLMQNKEEELNAIIMELRKNYNLLQDKCAKEESDKIAVMDDLSREKEARVAAEKLQTSFSEDLEKVRQEQQTSNQKIASLNDMYKRLQDYNTSLQQYNSKLQTELSTANETLKRVEGEKASVAEHLSTLKGQYSSLQDQLTSSKASQEEAVKQKEALISEVGCLRTELQQARDDRDRQLSQVNNLTDELAKYKDFTGRSVSELDSLTMKSNELEAKCLTQNDLVKTLQDQLAVAHKKLQMSDLSAMETRKQFEEQNVEICDLRNRLADAEVKLIEGEKLRKKLHNTILVNLFHKSSRVISVYSAEYGLYYLMKVLVQMLKSLLSPHLQKPWDGELTCCKMVA
ncbi:Kinesin-like protein KIN-14N [Bienertia sinuspersici]